MRLFIGVPLPPDRRLSQVTHALCHALPEARPVPPGSWHVTLRFLGEMADPGVVEEALRRGVAGHHAMPVTVRGLGAFQGPKRARIVWARVEAKGLKALAASVVDATRSLGEPPRESFVAHATLLRLGRAQDVGAQLEAHQDVLAEGMIDRVVLYRSMLGPRGPAYERLAEVPLANGSP